jgi:rhamnogalacturonan endolyase
VVDRAAAIYTQAGDYLFYVKADEKGHFELKGVRSGTYTLYAWETQGPITQSLAKDGVEVKGETLDLGDVAWDAPYHPNLVFQIGKADRMAGEFKFGSSPRTNQWMNEVPGDLTFVMGKSKEAEDWYYAQKTGTWTVKFNVDKVPARNAYLTVAVAGGGANVTAAVNGTEVGTLQYGDDASVRRAANRSGRYGRNEFVFPASVLKAGENELTLKANGAGLMYDTIVMETD